MDKMYENISTTSTPVSLQISFFQTSFSVTDLKHEDGSIPEGHVNLQMQQAEK
jgi:hypothetical protein